MRIIGLTGGTGSGKSTVATYFEDAGIPVIDADKIGHDLIAPGGSAVDAVVEAFGEAIVVDSAIDRAKLGAIVFEDPEALVELNAIVHPALFGEIGQRCINYAEGGKEAVIVDAALLAEGEEREAWLSDLILVLCDDDIRVERLVQYRGLEADVARQRIAAQSDPEKKRSMATWVIDNSGDLDALHTQAATILQEIHGTTG